MINIGLAITKNKEKFILYKNLINDSVKCNQLINIINVSCEKILYKNIKDLNILLTYSIKSSYLNKKKQSITMDTNWQCRSR